MKEISRGARESGRTNKKFLWKQNPKRGTVMGCLNTNNFYFIFSDFILIFFLFFFWIIKRYVTPQSHDRSHGMMS